jgi:chromosome segregation protein
MLLKKIEIQGFKSFVDRTELVFEPGISAIVGPNGCGKSNVSDSIRWVLGEQSAKALRGSAMMDVIFNGTENRKPSGMAEVSLTISNEDRKLPTDFPEVTVTRRAFRSGESEYLLNKTPCRLKDIYALFTDTGVGTDGYSLLEQGKMDLILSSRPADRRAVFEEAAGITRYKDQRDEALRKLESTDHNLARVNDIVLEVKRQINSLERQARKAERYKVLKAELDQLQGRLLMQEYREAVEREAALRQSLEEIRAEASAVEAQSTEKEARQSELQVSLLADEESLSQATAVVRNLEAELAQLDRKIEINRTLIVNLADRKERAGHEAGFLRERETAAGQALEGVQQEAQAAGTALAILAQELEEMGARLQQESAQRKTLTDQAQGLQQQILDLINRRIEMRGEADSLQGKLVVLEQQAAGLRQELEQGQEALHQASLRLEEAAGLAGAKQEEVRNLEGHLGGRTQRRQDLEAALAAAEEALSGALASHSSLQSRLAVLQELSRVLEGYEAGPRALLLEGQAQTGLPLESLARHVRTKPEFEVAVELALGRGLQTLLAGNLDQARQALRWLKEKNQGRASVLAGPMPAFEAPAFPSELLAEAGVRGPLASVLDSDPGMETVVRWLAGPFLLVEDFDAAWRLKERLPHWAQAITLQGEILTPTGLLTGGSLEAPERGLLGREREIEDLKVGLERTATESEARRQDRDRIRRELTELGQQISQASTELQAHQIAAAELEKERLSRLQEHERLTADSVANRRALEEITGQSAVHRERSAKLETGLAEMVGSETRLKQELDAALAQADRLRADESALQAALSEKRVEQASKKERQDSLATEQRRLQAELGSLREQAGSKDSEANQAAAELGRLRAENEGLESSLAGLFGQKDQAQEDVKKAGEARQERQNAIHGIDGELKELRQRAGDCQDRRHKAEMGLQESNLAAERLKGTLVVEYHLDLEAQPELPVGEAEGTVDPRTRVQELKSKVEELGAVNPAAAEEYQELEQRLATLSTQLDDLNQAKADLHKVIGKINQTTRERFLQTFETVQVNFQETFKQLFRGGEAKLTLMDEGDLLEAGIEIIARPPGKRQQTISLLSGGEKALTAIALLFALFRLKPSPFCLLDEIDAPLDDANITRFSSLLTDYAKRSQFIVITHSKLTMEKADVLYGITMEESGVSRVLSAKFKDDKPLVTA